MPPDTGEVRPVQWWLTELLFGRLTMDEVPPAVASWSQHAIYQGAIEVLSLPQHERRAALDKIPATIRPYVEEEARRVWAYRRQPPSI